MTASVTLGIATCWHASLNDLQIDRWVSLTPEAAHSLKRSNFDHQTAGEIYNEYELRKNQREYFLSQIEWAARFDAWIQDIFPLAKETGARPAHHHLSKIKYSVDSIIVLVLKLQGILDRINPHSVFLVSRKCEIPQLNVENYEGLSEYYLPQLLSDLCKVRGITFHNNELEIPTRKKVVQPPSQISYMAKKLVKPFYDFFRFKKWRAKRVSRPRTVLVLDSGVETIDEVIRDIIHAGERVVIKTHQEITLHTAFWQKKIKVQPLIRLPPFSARIPPDLIFGSEGLTDISLTKYFEPFFNAFVNSLVPEYIASVIQMQHLCRDQNISFVLARGSSGQNYHAALNAAKNLNIPAVCLQHSCGCLLWQDWLYGDMRYFNVLASTDPVSMSLYSSFQNSEPWSGNCRIVPAQHYLRSLAQNKRHSVQTQKHVLLFVPKKRPLWRDKLNTFFYDAAWFYEWHCKLIEWFATTYPNGEFIYKHTSALDWAESTVFRFIHDKGFKNVKIVSGDPVDHFYSVTHVLVDDASTTLFEATASGLPVLAVYHKVQNVSPLVKNFFGDSLAGFDSFETGIEAVRRFLSSHHSLYRHRFNFDHVSSYKNILSGLENS